MKIAIVLPHGSQFAAGKGNSIERVVEGCARLSRHRKSLHVVCDADAAGRGDFNTIPIDPTADRALRTRRAIAALRAWKPDLIEIHEQGSPASAIARAFNDSVTIMYRHGVPSPPDGRFRRLRHLRRHRPFDAHVFVSEAARRSFVEGFPSLSERTHVIPNGIDSRAWFADPRQRDRVIAYVGRPAPEKGFHELCEAVHEVLQGHQEWRAIFLLNEWQSFGGWARDQLAPLERCGERFEYRTDCGPEMVREILQRAAIAVIPSLCTEAFPLSALEAHAAGAAVVSSGTGGLLEASGAHALYLENVTPRTIADGVDRLIRDSGHREELAAGGQRFVASNHDIHRRARQLDDLRESLVAEGPARARIPQGDAVLNINGVGQ